MSWADVLFAYSCTATGSMLAYRDDGELWMHGVIIKGNSADHNGQSCKVRVTKTDRLIRCQ